MRSPLLFESAPTVVSLSTAPMAAACDGEDLKILSDVATTDNMFQTSAHSVLNFYLRLNLRRQDMVSPPVAMIPTSSSSSFSPAPNFVDHKQSKQPEDAQEKNSNHFKQNHEGGSTLFSSQLSDVNPHFSSTLLPSSSASTTASSPPTAEPSSAPDLFELIESSACCSLGTSPISLDSPSYFDIATIDLNKNKVSTSTTNAKTESSSSFTPQYGNVATSSSPCGGDSNSTLTIVRKNCALHRVLHRRADLNLWMRDDLDDEESAEQSSELPIGRVRTNILSATPTPGQFAGKLGSSALADPTQYVKATTPFQKVFNATVGDLEDVSQSTLSTSSFSSILDELERSRIGKLASHNTKTACVKPLVHRDTLKGLQLSILDRKWPADIVSSSMAALRAIQAINCGPFCRQTYGLKFVSGASSRPHPAKGDVGEDSFFISGRGLGVADGVSEWRTLGVNPGLFAGQLMEECKSLIESSCFPTEKSGLHSAGNLAKLVVRAAFNNVTAHGGSTAAVAVIDDGGSYLDIANLGDSTVCVFRRDGYTGRTKVFFRSQELQHTFNLPYQLTHLPSIDELTSLRRGGYVRLAEVVLKVHNTQALRPLDSPEDAQGFRVPLQEGDLVLLGTDGVFDNLFEEEIIELLSLVVSPVEAENVYQGKTVSATCPAVISRRIVDCAYARAQDPTAVIPFILNAEKAGILREGMLKTQGGKLDDITVVCAWVTSGSPSSSM